MMPMRSTRARLALAVTLTVVYVMAGKLGLSLAFVNASASAVWPPTGLAIGSLLLLGTGFFPVVTLGAFIVNVTTSGDVLSSIGIAIGNTLEAVIAVALVRRWAAGQRVFERPQDVLRFALLAAIFATAVSATIGVTTLTVAGLAAWSDFGPIWLTWWLGDASGALLVTPVVVLWFRAPQPRVTHWGELLALAVATTVTAFGIFGSAPLSIIRYPFLAFPGMIWAAFRFGPRVAATVVLATGVIAIWGTLNGFGPYALVTRNESLVALQAFMAVASLTTLTLAAAVTDRERTEARLLAIEQESRRVAEDAARVREEFLSVATHELRTPLTALSGYAQLANRAIAADRSDQLTPAIDAIRRQASRLGTSSRACSMHRARTPDVSRCDPSPPICRTRRRRRSRRCAPSMRAHIAGTCASIRPSRPMSTRCAGIRSSRTCSTTR